MKLPAARAHATTTATASDHHHHHHQHSNNSSSSNNNNDDNNNNNNNNHHNKQQHADHRHVTTEMESRRNDDDDDVVMKDGDDGGDHRKDHPKAHDSEHQSSASATTAASIVVSSTHVISATNNNADNNASGLNPAIVHPAPNRELQSLRPMKSRRIAFSADTPTGDDGVDGAIPHRPVCFDDSITRIPARVLSAEITCPICLGIIRKTSTFMECLHRFCAECIEKYLRLGTKECPKCRIHCASRRSLRADPNFDALIATLHPDIDAYEEAEGELIEQINREAHHEEFAKKIDSSLKKQAQAKPKKATVSSKSAAAAGGSGDARPNKDKIVFWLQPAKNAGELPALKQPHVSSYADLTMHKLSKFLCRQLSLNDPSQIDISITQEVQNQKKNVVLPRDLTLEATYVMLWMKNREMTLHYGLKSQP